MLVHIRLGVGSAVEALRQQAGLGNDAVPDSQFPAILRQVYTTGDEGVLPEVLGVVQSLIQPVAVLQFQHRLPLVQPVGFSLAPLRPCIAEVDGVAHQIAGRIVLREDIGDLRQAAVHIHRYALLDSLRMQRIQRQEQLVRQFGIRVLAVVGKSDPDALAVVALTSLIRMA